jgi:hypothetical protein
MIDESLACGRMKRHSGKELNNVMLTEGIKNRWKSGTKDWRV